MAVMLERDFFLLLCKQTAVCFVSFVFENCCRIHDKIDLGLLYWEKKVSHDGCLRMHASSGTLERLST
jgi:hypothetical protein